MLGDVRRERTAMVSVSEQWVEINKELLAGDVQWWDHPLAKRWILSTSERPIDWRGELVHMVTAGSSALLEFTDPADLVDRFGRSEKWPSVTDKTASQLYQWALIYQFLGAWPSGVVVEVGAGYGNLARIGLLNSAEITEWHIVDLPAMLVIQRSFLQNSLPPNLFQKLYFHPAENVAADPIPNPDLAIAVFSVTETPPETIASFCRNVFAMAKRAWIVGQWTFYGAETLQKLLDELLQTHDCAWRPFIYCELDDWPTAEVHADKASGPHSGTLSRLEDLPVNTTL
jgi:hypothetical protein